MPLTAKGDEGSSDCPWPLVWRQFRGATAAHATIFSLLAPRPNSAAVLGSISSAQRLRKARRSRPHGLYVTQASPLMRFSALRLPPHCKQLRGQAGRIGYPLRTNAPASSTPPMNSARTTWRVTAATHTARHQLGHRRRKEQPPAGPVRRIKITKLSRPCHHCSELGLPLRTATRARSCPGFGPMMIR